MQLNKDRTIYSNLDMHACMLNAVTIDKFNDVSLQERNAF
jgi:hypothetical protein